MANNALDATLINYFNALSVLLIIITIFYNMMHNDITNKLFKDTPPKGQTSELDKLINDMKFTFFKWLPVFFLILISTYTMLPLAKRIIDNSTFRLVDFCFLKTTYILICISLIIFLISSFYIGYNLVKKWMDLIDWRKQ